MGNSFHRLKISSPGSFPELDLPYFSMKHGKTWPVMVDSRVSSCSRTIGARFWNQILEQEDTRSKTCEAMWSIFSL